MQIVAKHFQDKEIVFDNRNGVVYLNATKTVQHFSGKRLDNWKNSQETIEYINALSKHLKLGFGDLLVTKRGGKLDYRGTWLHPKLVIFFSRWLSPEFAVWCDLQIEEMIKETHSKDSLLSQITKNIAEVERIQKKVDELTTIVETMDFSVKRESLHPKILSEVERCEERYLALIEFNKKLMEKFPDGTLFGDVVEF
jgi:hypothetical protein